MITEKQAEEILKSAEDDLKLQGWSKTDIFIAQYWISHILINLLMSNAPTGDKKFPEVLRMLANMLDLIRDKKNES
jgi:hypothetical protein